MPKQLELNLAVKKPSLTENDAYLSQQLITYLGNKRGLLDFIGRAIDLVKQRLSQEKLACFDVFSGSGIVARYLKRHSNRLFTNDLETYAAIINHCYLTNHEEFPLQDFKAVYKAIRKRLETEPLRSGFIAEMYAPADDQRIKAGERVFYTTRNARYLDSARQLIETAPQPFQPYLIAPLLAEASIHANTAGVFKGFYKNRDSGIGQYGGRNRDAQVRILGDIKLNFPVFSNFSCDYQIFCGDANQVCHETPEVDLAYLDPPYNQHPYGSNYFMLNTIADYTRPEAVSSISGIPANWKRSPYNQRQKALAALSDLVENLKAKFILISFNSEGFISMADMKALCSRIGRLSVLESRYNTFRGSRNLANRSIHLTEYLYLVEKY